MRRKLRITALIVAVLLLVVGLGLVGLYQASQHVPEFYTQALHTKPVEQAQASQELEARVTTLYNDARRSGSWHAMFSAEQINAWLSIDLVEKHGDLIPSNLHDPRVHITPDDVTLALRVEDATITTVFSLSVDVYIDGPSQIAFRVRGARAGAVPLPLGDVLQQITQAAREMQLPLRWTEVEGDPVALLTITPADEASGKVLILEKLELREGAIYLSGQTALEKESRAVWQSAQAKRVSVAVESGTGENSKRHR